MRLLDDFKMHVHSVPVKTAARTTNPYDYPHAGVCVCGGEGGGDGASKECLSDK